MIGTRRTALAALAVIAASAAAAKGTITTFEVQGAQQTSDAAINDAGTISGDFHKLYGEEKCFIRAQDGTITRFRPSESYNSGAGHINAFGVIVGQTEDRNRIWYGFVRAKDGVITTFAPVASTTLVQFLGRMTTRAMWLMGMFALPMERSRHLILPVPHAQAPEELTAKV